MYECYEISYRVLDRNSPIFSLVTDVFSGYCVGVSYAFLWYGSILLGFYFLYAPLLPLLFVNRKLFRRITDCLFSSWESFNTVMVQTSAWQMSPVVINKLLFWLMTLTQRSVISNLFTMKNYFHHFPEFTSRGVRSQARPHRRLPPKWGKCLDNSKSPNKVRMLDDLLL